MKKERNIMRMLTSLGLSPTQAIELLTHRAVGLAQGGTGVLEGLFDATDRREGGEVVVWFNDIENDPRYGLAVPLYVMLMARAL